MNKTKISPIGIGMVLGVVRVNRPHVYENRSFECAAWSETSESETGLFPLVLAQNTHAPHDLYLRAELPSKVTHDYFPALWGGMPVSSEPYRQKNTGQPRVNRISISMIEAIKQTGHSPPQDRTSDTAPQFEYYMAPEYWHMALEYHCERMETAYRRLPEFWAEYEQGEKNLAKFITDPPELMAWNRKGFRSEQSELTGDMSRVGMIAHFGARLQSDARAVEEIRRSMQYLRMLPNFETNSWIELHNRNCGDYRRFMGLPEFRGPERQW